MNTRASHLLNRIAVAECSRGFQPTDQRNLNVIRRVATIQPERLS